MAAARPGWPAAASELAAFARTAARAQTTVRSLLGCSSTPLAPLSAPASCFLRPAPVCPRLFSQMVVERRIRERGDDPRAVGRDAFLAEAWQWRDEYGGAITQQLRRLGASCDWSRERFTLDDGLSAAVAEAFLRLHERGLVYRGARMINWSPSLQTAVSDIEVDFTTEQGKLYFFRYPVENPGPDDPPHLDVATTRPETILGDTAVAVAPGDPRFAALVGKRCVVPLTNPPRSVPIVADEQVDPEFGTGALKITPAHDANDFEVGNRHNLERLCVMEKDATMSASDGPRYAGLDRFDCRKRVWEDLQEAGLAIKADEYENRVPRSQRGGEIVEPMLSEQASGVQRTVHGLGSSPQLLSNARGTPSKHTPALSPSSLFLRSGLLRWRHWPSPPSRLSRTAGSASCPNASS